MSIPRNECRRVMAAIVGRKKAGSRQSQLSPSDSLRKGDLLIDGKGNAFRVAGVTPSRDQNSSEELTARLVLLEIQEHGFQSARGLTVRETQVARLLACRATNAEVAKALGVSCHTARNHTRRVLEKLEVSSKSAVRDRLVGESEATARGRVKDSS